MKKTLLFALVVTLAAGCSKTETIDRSSSAAIGFEGAYIANPVQSKAVEEILEEEIDAFQVYGGYPGVTVFDNVAVTRSGAAWGYPGGDRYWVNGQQYTFAAYAPAAAAATVAVNDGKYLTIEYASDAGNQYDLIYAAHRQTGAATGNAPIQFAFKHLLSMVKFTFVSEFADGVTVTVSDFKVNGINTAATFTGNGTDAMNYGSWSVPAVPGEFASAVAAISTNQGTAESDPFVVIPQNGTTVSVAFNVTVADAGGTIADKPMTAEISADWEMGLRYNYVAKISGTDVDLDPIVFTDPKVSPWTDGEGGELTWN